MIQQMDQKFCLGASWSPASVGIHNFHYTQIYLDSIALVGLLSGNSERLVGSQHSRIPENIYFNLDLKPKLVLFAEVRIVTKGLSRRTSCYANSQSDWLIQINLQYKPIRLTVCTKICSKICVSWKPYRRNYYVTNTCNIIFLLTK